MRNWQAVDTAVRGENRAEQAVTFTKNAAQASDIAVIRKLDAAGAGQPAGRSYHAAFGSAGKLAVFDVWDSQASFDRFGQTLMPILKEVGVDPGQPQVMPIHNVIVGAGTR